MHIRPFSALLLAGVIAISAIASISVEAAGEAAVDPKIAAMSDAELVAARQAAMKQDGGILRQASRLTGDDAIAAAMTLIENFTRLPDLFRPGSMTADSHARPLIWEEFDKFKAIFAADRAEATSMLEAAKSGDSAAYAAALRGISESCGSCHQTYRSR